MDKEQFFGKEYKLVTVKGWKRIFNKVVSRKTWKQFANEKDIAILNVIKDPESQFNAVVFKVNDLSELKKREEDYETTKVETEVGACILFFSLKTKDNIMPLKRYLNVCRKGAYSWGEAFGKKFDKTTFLADGRTVEEFLDT